MADKGRDRANGNRARRFGRSVGHKAARKARARKGDDESIWNWFGMMGLIGWSVSVPTVAGVALGRWIDARWPGQISWTLTLLAAGLGLGCFSAWYWMSREGGRK
jgi:ATP synthase protein I